MTEELLSGYLIHRGSALDKALLVKFMQKTYQEMSSSQNFEHLSRTVEQYLCAETPLWWVNTISLSPSPIACLWIGNAIDQLTGERHAHIFLIYVIPEHRRRGLGKALMQYAHNWASQRGDRQITLQVFTSNTPALNLYNHLGYQTQSLWMVKQIHNS